MEEVGSLKLSEGTSAQLDEQRCKSASLRTSEGWRKITCEFTDFLLWKF